MSHFKTLVVLASILVSSTIWAKDCVKEYQAAYFLCDKDAVFVAKGNADDKYDNRLIKMVSTATSVSQVLPFCMKARRDCINHCGEETNSGATADYDHNEFYRSCEDGEVAQKYLDMTMANMNAPALATGTAIQKEAVDADAPEAIKPAKYVPKRMPASDSLNTGFTGL